MKLNKKKVALTGVGLGLISGVVGWEVYRSNNTEAKESNPLSNDNDQVSTFHVLKQESIATRLAQWKSELESFKKQQEALAEAEAQLEAEALEKEELEKVEQEKQEQEQEKEDSKPETEKEESSQSNSSSNSNSSQNSGNTEKPSTTPPVTEKPSTDEEAPKEEEETVVTPPVIEEKPSTPEQAPSEPEQTPEVEEKPVVKPEPAPEPEPQPEQKPVEKPVVDDSSFIIKNPTYEHKEDGLWIRIQEVRSGNQHYFVAEIDDDGTRLRTTFAKNGYATGLQRPSSLANVAGAVLAINASGFYMDAPIGPVVRYGVVHRELAEDLEPMTIDWDQTMGIGTPGKSSSDYVNEGIMHTFRFGPSLINHGNKLTLSSSKWGGLINLNGRAPRTAIGQRSNKNWILLVSNGRISGVPGLTIYELQNLMAKYGCRVAYNLDGGGSSAMIYKGKLLNKPSDGAERAVADLIYFY